MATATAQSSSSSFCSVKVNVRLCGSIPRQEMEDMSLAKCAPYILQSSHAVPANSYLSGTNGSSIRSTHHTIENDDVAQQVCSQLCNMQRGNEPLQPASRQSLPTFAAPAWAVPATGEARLEPVCDTIELQAPVDLTSRAVFRIGRSPQSDVQLMHATSSRKHAMLFHHSNGSCYIVDCGSAHGTFVNGVRISSPPKGGVVVPHKVRRGSMIRFGGPGAPQFMLKAFSFELSEMRDFNTPSMECESPGNAVVVHNTRLNALGKSAKASLLFNITSKRSFESMDTMDETDMRCSSPPLSPEQQPVRLVSPDLGQPSKRRRVSFCSEPSIAFYPHLISPDVSSDEHDCEE